MARVLTNTAIRLISSAATTSATALARATGTAAPKRWPLVERSAEIDPDEGEVLDVLEDAARKAFVLFDLADGRLLQWSQTTRTATSATMTPHTPPGSSTTAPPFAIPPVSTRRKSSSSSSSTNSDLLALRQQEDAAGDACALYFKSLAFICVGHERFKRYWESRRGRNSEYEPSAELNDMVQWFRARFNDVYDKAEWAKARCADELPYVDRLVHDRARDISRQSAQAELLGDYAAAEEGYETSMWLLTALLDDIMYDGGRLPDMDRLGFERLIGSIRERLEGVRAKQEAVRAK
jgi:serine/threonine-protein kinase ULK/ATG1